MRERIGLHVAARGVTWMTCEAPYDLTAALGELARLDRVVSGRLPDPVAEQPHAARRRCGGGRAARSDRARAPPRQPRRSSSRTRSAPASCRRRRWAVASATRRAGLNQAMAAACDAVVLVTAGLPRQLKPAPTPSLSRWAGDELPPRLPCRQPRRRLQARGGRPHPRLSRAASRRRSASSTRMPAAAPIISAARPPSAQASGATASDASIPPPWSVSARDLLAPYLAVVGAANQGKAPYPGSPLVAQALLRPFDRMICCETRPETRLALERGAGQGPPRQGHRARRLRRAQRLRAAGSSGAAWC